MACAATSSKFSACPLEFWSHPDVLNRDFSAGPYDKQAVLLRGMDGHTAWANRALLQRAGITPEFLKKLTPDQRAYYGVDKSFQPNGFLVDAGTEKIEPLLPRPTPDELLKAGRAALEYNYSLGITAWLDPAAREDVLQGYKLLADHGELISQVAAFPVVLAKDPTSELAEVQKIRADYTETCRISTSAASRFSPTVSPSFPRRPRTSPSPTKIPATTATCYSIRNKFAELCIAADKQHLIIHVHAIGDGAVKAALDGIAAARAANGDSKLPHTITHEQFVRPEDFPRFRELGVISALQLFWAEASNDTIEILKPYVDPEIYKWQYPARSILDNGGIISGASDWPVSTANIFRAIYQAETRKGNEGVLDASQDMPREAMFYAYTRNAARAMNLDSVGTHCAQQARRPHPARP